MMNTEVLSSGILDNPLVLKAGGRLTYNTATHAISTTQAGEKISAECTTSLRRISAVTKKILEEVPTDTLTNRAFINLAHNIATINHAFKGYNDKLNQSKILKILDVFLRTITFNYISLTYDYLPAITFDDLKTKLGFAQIQQHRKQIFDEGQKLTTELYTYFEKIKGSRCHLMFHQLGESLLDLSADHFCELPDKQRLELLFIAKTVKYDFWQHSTSMLVDVLHCLISSSAAFPADFLRMQARMLSQLSKNLNSSSIMAEKEKQIIEITSYFAFKATWAFFTKTPDYVITLLNKLSNLPENFLPGPNYTSICILISSILHISSRVNVELTSEEISAICAPFREGFQLVWEYVLEEYRLPLLKGIVHFKDEPNFGAFLKSQLLATTLTSYGKLNPEERSHILRLVVDEPTFDRLPEEVIYGLMEQAKNVQERTAIFTRVMPRVNVNRALLSKEQQAIVLAFFEGFNKPQEMPPIKSLTECHRITLFEGLEEEDISKYPKVALHLCLLAAEEKLKKEQESKIENILSKIPLYKLPDEEFKKLLANKCLAAIFNGKMVEARLAESGTESQFEIYYGPEEEGKLKVDFSHLKQAMAEAVAVPPLPQGVRVDLEEFYKMFERINTSRPQEAGYVNPLSIRVDETTYTFEQLRTGMRRMLDNIQAETIPYAPRQGADKELAYTTLNRYLGHSLMALSQREAQGEDCSRYLLDLSIVGLYCYGRYIGVAQELYERLTGTYQADMNTLSAFLHKRLAARRAQILDKHISLRGGGNPDSHDYALAVKTVGLWFAVPKALGYQYQDGVLANQWIRTEAGQVSLFQACLKDYPPTLILNTIYKYIEGMIGHQKDKGREYVEMMQEWFKEQWAKEHTLEMDNYQKNLIVYNKKRKEYEEALKNYNQQLQLFEEGRIKEKPQNKIKEPVKPLDPSSQILFKMYDEDTGKITRKGLIYLAKRQGLLEMSPKEKAKDSLKQSLGKIPLFSKLVDFWD